MYDFAGWRGNQLRCWHRVLLCAFSPLICPSQKFDHTAGVFSFPWNSRTNTCGLAHRGSHKPRPILEGRATATIQDHFFVPIREYLNVVGSSSIISVFINTACTLI